MIRPQTTDPAITPRGSLNMRPFITATISHLAFAALLLSLAGCGSGEDIRTYDVPKVAPIPETAKATTTNPATKGVPTAGARLLAAIVPHGGEFWHFKLMGTATLVNPQFDAFVKFVEGIKFTSTKVADGTTSVDPKWTLPAGWTQKPGSGMRFATIIIGEAAHGIELTIFKLGPESGAVLPNVQRWAGQVGVSGVTQAKLADMTRPIIVDNQTATLVDVSGPGAPGDPSMAGPTRPAPPQPPVNPEKPERLIAPVPAGFVVDTNPGQFLIAKYDISIGGKTGSLTVSSAGGDIESNLNRWRQQVGLTDWDEASIQKAFEAQKELVQSEIAGRRAIIIDIIGPESAGEKRERIMGALTSNPNGAIWFIKFRGSADLIASQKDAFDAFLKSIRFEN